MKCDFEYGSVQELAQELVSGYEASHGKVKDHLELEKQARATHHATMEERVAYLERTLNDSADRHAAMEEGHSSLGQQLQEIADHHSHSKNHHATIAEQLDAIVQQLQTEISTREADIYELRELVGGETLARAEHHSSVKELIASERAAREKHAEQLVSDYEAHHGRVLDHLELEKEARAIHHASIEERVAYLEKLLNDSADRHAAME